MERYLNLTDMDLTSYTTLPQMARAWADYAAGVFGGRPSEYLFGQEGTTAETSRIAIQAEDYIDTLRSNLAELSDTYDWDNVPDNSYMEEQHDADLLAVRDDVSAIVDALNLKLSKGSKGAMSIRLMKSLKKYSGDINEVVDTAIRASYEDKLREGVQRTSKQQKLISDILKAIREA